MPLSYFQRFLYYLNSMLQSGLDSIIQYLQNYAYHLSRGIKFNHSPVTLRITHDTAFRVQDSEHHIFELEGLNLENAQDSVSAGHYNAIVLKDCQFHFDFDFTNIIAIVAITNNILLTGPKTSAKPCNGYFFFKIFPNAPYERFNKRTKGYLRILAKQHFASEATKDEKELKMTNFIPDNRRLVLNNENQINERQRQKNTKVEERNFVSELNEDGKNILKKLQKIFRRKDLYEHILGVGIQDIHDYNYIKSLAYPEEEKSQ